MDRARFASLAAAIGCVAAVGIALSLSIPLLSLEMERMGASAVVIGLNTAVAGVASILVAPAVPRLAARFGVLPLLAASVATGCLTLVAFKAAFGIGPWFALRFVFSGALGVLFVLSEYWINAAAPPGRRGLVMGVYATVLGLGFAAGPGILALVGTSGWPPYLAGAGLFAVASLPLLAARGLAPAIGEPGTRTVFSFLRAAPAATLAALVFGAVETGAFAILPLYGLRLGLSPEAAAGLVSAVALGSVLLQIPIGALSDRIDRRAVLLGAALAGLVGALVIPLAAADPRALAGVLLVWGGATTALYTVGLAHLGARFTGADLASANAAFLILYNTGLVLGPPLIGAAMDRVPPHGFAWSIAGLYALYLGVVAARLGAGRGRPAA